MTRSVDVPKAPSRSVYIRNVFFLQIQHFALYLFTDLVVTSVGQLRLLNVSMRYHLRQTGLEKRPRFGDTKAVLSMRTLSVCQVSRCIRAAVRVARK